MNFGVKSDRWDAPFEKAPEGVIREEIFSVERLESRAQALALQHSRITSPRRGRSLAPLVRESGLVLERCRRQLDAAAARDVLVPPAGRWLLENFHLVSGLGKSINRELPSAYYRELPKLGPGEMGGYPRIYGLARKWAAHCDSHFESEILRRFVAAYQAILPLTLGELWALSITLRIVLLENLRHQVENVVVNLWDTERADRLADLLLGLGKGPVLDPAVVPARFKNRPLPMAFSLRLFQRLKGQDSAMEPVLTWLSNRLAALNITVEDLIRREHQEWQARNATCKNVISSLRDIGLLDWHTFVEKLSPVDGVFNEVFDFQALSFATRDRYRHAVENLARGSRHSQLEIARFAVGTVLAARAAGQPEDSLEADVGDCLIGPGSRAFERQIEYSPPLPKRALRVATSLGLPLYLGAIAGVTLYCLSFVVDGSPWGALRGPLALCMELLALIPASEIAIALVNHAVMRLWPAYSLPAFALKAGVPAGLRTMVVMPVILDGDGDFRELVELLEVHYLANPDGELYFGLLTDWPDAPTEEREGEAEVLKAAFAGVAQLNLKYGPGPGGFPRFGLYQRRRRYNAVEGQWMGWERKRGKLMEFNRLLRGAQGTSYDAADGSRPLPPPGVRYVITLDRDTRLPRGSARRLVGTLAHPLNRPRLDAAGKRVLRGYGILQPRISPTLPLMGEGTLLNRLSSGRAGTDPYTTAVPSVYHDLFDEGSYAGKGIYDVDAFESCLEGRFPENHLLSHDLLEGSLARSGLASDIEFFEEFDGHHQAAMGCRHRWARGDWQLLPWILGYGPGRGVRLGAVARWKMVDNLRRSLLAPATFLTLVAACLLPMSRALAWSGLALAGLALPQLLNVLVAELFPRRPNISLLRHWQSLSQELDAGLLKFLFSLAMLPADAWAMVDAVFRTLFRLFMTRRRLLEWTSSAHARKELVRTRLAFFRLLKAGPIAGAGLLALLYALGRPAWPLALVLALVWLVSPLIGRWYSLPVPRPSRGGLDPRRAETLSRAARRTWHFFETYVNALVHHLPPDNFQEDPRPVLATRTSPTNLGLYLLSCVAANDFGWLSTPRLLDRFEKALDSMESMEKYQGHFFNWYDLRSLRPLEPRFVSTVDSGNLAGHLLVAWQALQDLLKGGLVPALGCRGLRQSLDLAFEASRVEAFAGRVGIHRQDLASALAAFDAELAAPASNAPDYVAQVGRLSPLAETLADIARSLHQEHGRPEEADFLRWTEVLKSEVEGHAEHARLLLAAAPAGFNPSLGGAAASYRARGSQLAARDAEAFAARVNAAAARMHALFDAMRFGFLYEPGKKLFSIGYRAADGCLDQGQYDLLASEARLTSFVAVARGDVDTEHWYKLGRPLTAVGRGMALLSWSGSMFEYLMPLLVMPSPPGSLLAETYKGVVERQIGLGRERDIPWGVSESVCAVRDKDMTYQYSDFGVEGLGIKRGLGRHKVVAPYATALAGMVDPEAAFANLARLTAMGALGPHGYYDALDFGAARYPEGHPWTVVRTCMAHHQGMGLIAILNVLQGGRMQRRFLAVPMLRAADLLLQERTPWEVAIKMPDEDAVSDWPASDTLEDTGPQRDIASPHTLLPQTHLLGNGNYSVMVTSAGGGYSLWNKACVTRYRSGPARDPWGTFIFIRDMNGGEAWSATYLPTRREPDSYKVSFREDKAEFTRRDGPLESRLEVAVSPEDDVEVRRLTLKNHGFRSLDLELTSYAEIALCSQDADAAHPAFSKLFVQTEYVAGLGALLAHRRPQDSTGTGEDAWAAHLGFSETGDGTGVHFETDRSRFLGRGRDLFDPLMEAKGSLMSNTVGAVLDPVFSLRRRLKLEPGGVARVTFATAAASSRDKVLALAARIKDGANVERLFGQAWVHAQVQMRHRGILPDEARLFQVLAGHLLHPDPRLRPPAEALAKNRLGRAVLWSQGVSGDLPLLVLRIDEAADREIFRQLMLAWEYWRLKNLAVDLVILNEEPASYAADFQRLLEDMARLGLGQTPAGSGSGIHVVKACQIPESERDLILCAAQAVLRAGHGSLSEQLARVPPQRSLPPELDPPEDARDPSTNEEDGEGGPRGGLEFMNGLGGFTSEGSEYRVVLVDGQDTPAPWINVVANPEFGFLASESGSGYTWAHNAHENKLSPWSNDPVSDPAGEAFYVRDEDSGALFTPTALPIRLKHGRYTAVHGQGYSRFESAAQGIRMSLTQFVPLADSVKISRLVVTNHSDRVRRLSVTAYAEWVLGSATQATAHSIVTEWNAGTGTLLARNPFNAAFPEAVAFLDLGAQPRAFTADRRDFLGRYGSLQRPQALGLGRRLAGRVGAGWDPCAALQSVVELKPGAGAEFRVLLGQGSNREDAVRLVETYRAADLDAVLRGVKDYWGSALGALRVRTPDRAMDIMLNRWLPYQTLACRVWGRAAFYQCSGAYGFRDQLQDVLALVGAWPDVARSHLLRAAGKQFLEGDVLHWWHPPTGVGVRTHITDDRLWLPYAVCRYAEASGDWSVLEERIPFLEGPALEPGAKDLYFQPQASQDSASLYEHCARALERSLGTGTHGLPLMGGGDWNDGMNKVGAGGKGESVWLAWFLADNLRRFAAIAAGRGETARAAAWLEKAASVAAAAEDQGWDGDWYRRAFFDDGSPLGSAGLAECRIDSIAQSWAVLSGAADPAHAARAMAALEEYLWKKGDGLMLLLTPPFAKTRPDPGYIMGYLPGIRENGGQYSHASAWCVAAFAGLGEGAKAHDLFAMMNPVRLAGTRAGMQRYKVEPYVMAGDVYSQAPHVGRGGWTWYSGSAGWMQRAGVESILGLSLHGDAIGMDPCIPPDWPGYELDIAWGGARCVISVSNPDSVAKGVRVLELDGVRLPAGSGGRIPIPKDGKPHRLEVTLGAEAAIAPPAELIAGPEAAVPGGLQSAERRSNNRRTNARRTGARRVEA